VTGADSVHKSQLTVTFKGPREVFRRLRSERLRHVSENALLIIKAPRGRRRNVCERHRRTGVERETRDERGVSRNRKGLRNPSTDFPGVALGMATSPSATDDATDTRSRIMGRHLQYNSFCTEYPVGKYNYVGDAILCSSLMCLACLDAAVRSSHIWLSECCILQKHKARLWAGI